MKRSHQIITLSVGFLLGLIMAGYYAFTLSWLWLGLVIFGCIVLSQIRSKLGYMVIFGLGLMLGIGRMVIFVDNMPAQTIDDWQYQKVSLSGTVVGEPSWDDTRQYVFYLGNLRVDNRPVAGVIKVHALTGSVQEGYRVDTTGKLYRAMGRATSQLYYAPISILSTKQPWYVVIKNQFWRGLNIALAQPAAGFIMGLLVGARSMLSRDLQDVLGNIGLSHMVAVSGYNLTIIIAVIYHLIGRRWAWAGLVASLWFSFCFVVISGASASIVRAAVMVSLFLICRHYGRSLHLLSALGLGALITTLLDPSYLTSDLGWQLSFLSLLGIILLAGPIQSFLPQRFGVLGEILAVTLSAQIMTTPLLVYKFGFVSLVAPLANLLIMPLVPLLMLAGFMAGLVGMFAPHLAYWLMSPLRWLVLQVLDLTRYLASLSWSKTDTVVVSIVQLVFLYIVILAFSLVVSRRTPTRQASKLI